MRAESSEWKARLEALLVSYEDETLDIARAYDEGHMNIEGYPNGMYDWYSGHGEGVRSTLLLNCKQGVPFSEEIRDDDEG